MTKKITVRGQKWTLRRTRRGLGESKQIPTGAWGWCDVSRREIRVAPEEDFPNGRDELDVLIHESLHALFPDLDEEVVTQSGRELADILVAAGVVPGTGHK